jgi:hypothetical protein
MTEEEIAETKGEGSIPSIRPKHWVTRSLSG